MKTQHTVKYMLCELLSQPQAKCCQGSRYEWKVGSHKFCFLAKGNLSYELRPDFIPSCWLCFLGQCNYMFNSVFACAWGIFMSLSGLKLTYRLWQCRTNEKYRILCRWEWNFSYFSFNLLWYIFLLLIPTASVPLGFCEFAIAEFNA